MVQGTVLRTNYKQTGGVLDIIGVGGGVPLASAMSGAGTNLPYGGFIYARSYALGVSEANLTANILGDSTFGIMSLYYGSAMYPAGYKFLPLGVRVRSGASAMAAGMSGAWLSIPKVWLPAWTSSIWMLEVYGKAVAGSATSIGAGDGSALLTLGGLSFLLDIWGFIISSP